MLNASRFAAYMLEALNHFLGRSFWRRLLGELARTDAGAANEVHGGGQNGITVDGPVREIPRTCISASRAAAITHTHTPNEPELIGRMPSICPPPLSLYLNLFPARTDLFIDVPNTRRFPYLQLPGHPAGP